MMRIVSRKEFLSLPSGTLFCQCAEPWAFNDLHVKFDSLIWSEDANDFVCMPLANIEANSSEQWSERLEDMDINGASYPLDLDMAGREACSTMMLASWSLKRLMSGS